MNEGREQTRTIFLGLIAACLAFLIGVLTVSMPQLKRIADALAKTEGK